MKSVVFLLCCVTSLTFLGCGDGGPPPPAGLVAKAEVLSKFPELKKSLEAIASSGQKGTGFESLKQQIDQSVRSSNATLADDLIKDYDALSKSSGAAEIKQIATKMVAKIP